MSDRTSLMLHTLNLDTLQPVIIGIFAAMYGTTPENLLEEGWAIDGPLVVGRDTKATQFQKDYGRDYAVVCTEGVGWTCDDNGRVLVPLRCGFSATNEITVHPRVLLQHLGEETDLATFIRIFGSRLESNFAIWRSRLVNVKAAESMEEV